MLDSRFPNLYRVFEAPGLLPDLRVKAQMFVAKVMARVPGAQGCYNAKFKELFFYWQRLGPSGGPLSIPIVGEDAWPLDQRDIDDSVDVLKLALTPWKEREKIEAAQKAVAAKAKVEKDEKKKAERRPHIQAHADFLNREKRGVPKTSVYVERPSGLVLPHDKGDS